MRAAIGEWWKWLLKRRIMYNTRPQLNPLPDYRPRAVAEFLALAGLRHRRIARMGEHYARALVRASFGLWCCHHWGRTVEPMLLGVDRKNPLVRRSPTSLGKLCPERWLRAVLSLGGVAGAVSPA